MRLLEDQGRIDELTALADKGDPHARRRLAQLRSDRGRIDEQG